jgi:sigma-B regulation protein RsbU (phosphoserine phosphatase)
VQAGLLPVAAPRITGYDVAGVQLTSQAIGGDYYDYLPLADGRLGLVVADVSGKGIPAALIMATFRAALRSELRRSDDLAGALAAVNRTLLESQAATRFVTTVCGVLEPVSGCFAYVNAGHNPPLLLRADGCQETLDRGGPALGFFAEPAFEAGETCLAPGDALALFTDGVVEASDASDAEFGGDRLERALRATASLRAEAGLQAAIQATRAFSGRRDYDDDFTLVLVKRLARPG